MLAEDKVRADLDKAAAISIRIFGMRSRGYRIVCARRSISKAAFASFADAATSTSRWLGQRRSAIGFIPAV